jgi:hypothetical protein
MYALTYPFLFLFASSHRILLGFLVVQLLLFVFLFETEDARVAGVSRIHQRSQPTHLFLFPTGSFRLVLLLDPSALFPAAAKNNKSIHFSSFTLPSFIEDDSLLAFVFLLFVEVREFPPRFEIVPEIVKVLDVIPR